MKKLSCLLLAGIISCSAFSQAKTNKVSVEWGQIVKVGNKISYEEVVAYDEHNIYVLKEKNSGWSNKCQYWLDHYNEKMVLLKSAELDFGEAGYELFYNFIIQSGQNLYLFFSQNDKKNDVLTLYSQQIDRDSLQLISTPEKVESFSYIKKLKRTYYTHQNSSDGSKFLIFLNKAHMHGNSEIFGFHVYDKNMKKIWDREVEIPYDEALCTVDYSMADTSGSVYIVCRVFDSKESGKKKGKQNYEYHVLAYNQKSDSPIEYNLTLAGKFITDVRVEVSDNGDIVCAGFYSDRGVNSIKGAFYCLVDHNTKEVKAKSFKEFGNDFITQYMTDGQEARTMKKIEKGKNVELPNYDLHNLVMKENGGVYLVGEQYYEREVIKNVFDSKGILIRTEIHNYYYYNDIIVISISRQGEIEWAQKIHKRQASMDDYGLYSSYAMINGQDKLCFLYNDLAKNLTVAENKRIVVWSPQKKSAAVLAELNKDGKLYREIMFTTKDIPMKFRPKICLQMDNKHMVLTVQKKKKLRLGLLTIN